MRYLALLTVFSLLFSTTGQTQTPADQATTAQPTAVASAETVLETALSRLQQLLAERKLQEAESVATDALSFAEENSLPDGPSIGQLLQNLAFIKFDLGQHSDAEMLFSRVLDYRKRLGIEQTLIDAILLQQRAYSLLYLSRPEESVSPLLLSLEIRKEVSGADSVQYAQALHGYSSLKMRLGQFAEAELALREVLAILNRQDNVEGSIVGKVYGDLSRALAAQDKYEAADGAIQAALEAFDRDQEPDPNLHVLTLNNVAIYYLELGRYGVAEDFILRALKISEGVLGENYLDLANIYNTLGGLYLSMGRLQDAREVLIQAKELVRSTVGEHSAAFLSTADNLANVDLQLGNTESALNQSFEIVEASAKILGKGHPLAIGYRNNLAVMLQSMGRSNEAEKVLQEALSLAMDAYGESYQFFDSLILNLGEIYTQQGRWQEAVALFDRALSVSKGRTDVDPVGIAKALNKQGLVFAGLEKYELAVTAFEEALSIQRRHLLESDPALLTTQTNLAFAHAHLGGLEQARALASSALKLQEESGLADTPELANTYTAAGSISSASGDYIGASSYFRKGSQVFEGLYGRNHPMFGKLEYFLAGSLRNARLPGEALPHMETAARVYASRQMPNFQDRSIGRGSEFRRANVIFRDYIDNLVEASSGATVLLAEGFLAAQYATMSEVSEYFARALARNRTGNEQLAGLVRERQDLVNEWRRLGEKRTRAVGVSDLALAQELQLSIERVDEAISLSDSRLVKEYPSYFELSSPRPIELETLQGQLALGEAILVYVLNENGGHVWLVTATSARHAVVPASLADIFSEVVYIRELLQPNGFRQPRSFPARSAYKLYSYLIEPVEDMLAGIERITVVPDGPLNMIPFGILLVEDPTVGRYRTPEHFKTAPWLAKEYSVSVMPSASTFKIAQGQAKPSEEAERTFIGFGDPVIGGSEPVLTAGKASRTGLDSRVVADTDRLRSLPRLPETAKELSLIAEKLKHEKALIFTGDSATETRFRSGDFSEANTLVFATHALMAGEMGNGLGPGLVLTPPEKGTLDDDGYLSAAEISQVKLNADWVILSACNTASHDGGFAREGFSGLTKSFLYAGAKSVLVSHWPVESRSAALMTTSIFSNHNSQTSGAHAKALKAARTSMINGQFGDHYTHPVFWAPFVVVGGR